MNLLVKRTLSLGIPFFESFNHSNVRYICLGQSHLTKKTDKSLKTYITTKYVKYLDKFEQQFKSSLPSAHKLYRLFKDGTWELFSDTKEYYGVYMRVRAGEPLTSFTCKQLHLYQQLPRDLVKSVPLIISIALPFVQYLVLPLAYYMYPKALLCRYFWSAEQLKCFSAQDLESRHKHHASIINYLNMHSKAVPDERLRSQLLNLTSKLMRTDSRIEAREITALQPIFRTPPFSFSHISKRHRIHLWHLCKSMEVKKVKRDLELVRHIDLALHREGLSNVDSNLLKQVGLKRGVNSYDLSTEQLHEYLRKWLQVSTALTAEDTTLLLHTPALLNSQAYS